VAKSLTSGGSQSPYAGARAHPGQGPASTSTLAAAPSRRHPIDTQSEEVPLSHIVTVKTEVRDHAAISAACRRLQLPPPITGTAQLFSGEVSGLIFRLPDWTYPADFDTTTGQVHYDNFNGAWGDQAQLDRFLQIYAVERTRIEARKKGHQITEQALADGSIKLTIRIGGGS
jgi:hypothetical protein